MACVEKNKIDELVVTELMKLLPPDFLGKVNMLTSVSALPIDSVDMLTLIFNIEKKVGISPLGFNYEELVYVTDIAKLFVLQKNEKLQF